MTAMSLSMAPSLIKLPLSPSSEEINKQKTELKEKLEIRFGVHYVRELTFEESARRNAILKIPQPLSPNPALDISILKIAPESAVNYLPVLLFSTEEVLNFLIAKLHIHRLTKIDPFFSGGFARHCLAETSFQDLDLTFFLEREDFRLILHTIRDLIELKLRSLEVNLDFSSPEIFEFIESIYLYKKRTLIDSNKRPIASLISLGGIEFKFVLAKNYRYYVANYERFLVPITHNSLFFAHAESGYSIEKSTHAFEDLIFGEFAVDQPEAVTDFLFRLTHATTQGFGTHSSSQLLSEALKSFVSSYDSKNFEALSHKLHSHLDNHYSDPEGQMIDFVNLLSFLQGIDYVPLRHNYIHTLAKAVSCSREYGELRLFKGKKLEHYNTLILAQSQTIEEERKTAHESDKPPLTTSIEVFKPLSSLLEHHPEVSHHIVTLIQSLFFYEWLQKNPKISFDSTKRHWQLTLTTSKGNYSLSMPKQSIEEMAIHALDSWKELRKFATIFEEIVKKFQLSSFTFIESNKETFCLELLRASESASIHSLISLKLVEPSSTVTKEQMIKEMSTYLDKETLEEWNLQKSLRTLSNAYFKEKRDAVSLLIALLRQRIKSSAWKFGMEHFVQLNQRLQPLQNLPEKRELKENPNLRLLLSRSFILLLSKVPLYIEPQFFLEICHFELLANRLGILDGKKYSHAFSFIESPSHSPYSKENVLLKKMIEALTDEYSEKSKSLFCDYTEILCGFEGLQKEIPEILNLSKRLTLENFENRSSIMRQLICQIAQTHWRIAEESLSICQSKMEKKDFIQSLYLLMKAQILSKEIVALEKASVYWLSNRPSMLNLLGHFLIGLKLIDNFIALSHSEKERKEYAQKISLLVSHFYQSLKEGHLLFKQLPPNASTKMKTELQTMIHLLSSKEETLVWGKNLQRSLKDFFPKENSLSISSPPETILNLEKKAIAIPTTITTLHPVSAPILESKQIHKESSKKGVHSPRRQLPPRHFAKKLKKQQMEKIIQNEQLALEKEIFHEKMFALKNKNFHSMFLLGLCQGFMAVAGGACSETLHACLDAHTSPLEQEDRVDLLSKKMLALLAIPLAVLVVNRFQINRKKWFFSFALSFFNGLGMDSLSQKTDIFKDRRISIYLGNAAMNFAFPVLNPDITHSTRVRHLFSWIISCLTMQQFFNTKHDR